MSVVEFIRTYEKQMTSITNSDYQQFMDKAKKINELRQSRVRSYGVIINHVLLAPVASLFYSVQTNYWKPFFFASAAAAVGIPASVIDYGFTLAVAPPVTSAAMIISNSSEKRRKYKMINLQQADEAYFQETLNT